ncbi:MAG: restriction endonuclease subunit S [Bacteroidetes bacterium]|nr:restriction endonuclease subunit S [Bacteroidota bacterium]
MFQLVQQKTISLRSIKEIVLSLPDLPTQTRIASILSAIDDKIELNRQMNQTLEQMARNEVLLSNLIPYFKKLLVIAPINALFNKFYIES